MSDQGSDDPPLATLTSDSGLVENPPTLSTDPLASANVAMALYPLSAFRAMNAAALRVYEGIRKDGSQKGVVELMQSRDDLYDYLGYHAYESKLDALFAREKKKK